MSRHRQTILALALLGCLVLSGAVLAAPAPIAIDRWVVAGGGGHAEAAPYTLDGTIGQPVAGTAQNAGHELCSGFWCGAEMGGRIYLPLMLREF
jgi:hypothetical protein